MTEKKTNYIIFSKWAEFVQKEGSNMHELGVLIQAVKTVDRIAKENHIKKVKHITLAVGEESGYVPVFLTKLFPVAADQFPAMKDTQLKIEQVPGRGLQIKDLGY